MHANGAPVIAARGVGKSYPIRAAQRSTTLAETMIGRLRRPIRRATKETVWALRDVDFEVQRGEVVGIIGRNGAGKSTLLKLLSRITEPTTGEIRLRGRVGSLLEVGTGFHPELTGRENIFLNGAILGMDRRDIVRQFDSIVEFAGVSRFLDVPVKRYSTGMSVRLAFAVAAHLEPEILLVDEVLAVGDTEFQRRSLGKMSEIATEDARTVLFVSHNMAAIETLCHRCIVLEAGSIMVDDRPKAAIARYTEMMGADAPGTAGDFDLTTRPDRRRWERPLLQRVRLIGADGMGVGAVQMGEPLTIAIDVDGMSRIPGAFLGIDLRTDLDQQIATFHTQMKPPCFADARAGREQFVLRLGPLPLGPGRYWLKAGVWDPGESRMADRVDRAASFEVLPGNVYGSGYLPRVSDGMLFVNFDWELHAAERPAEESPEVRAGLRPTPDRR